MFKKIVLAVALIALPVLGAMAQQKFAHVNPQAIIVEMAEYKKAVADIEAMQKNYQDELQRTEEEFNKKYQELVAQQDSLPRNILEPAAVPAGGSTVTAAGSAGSYDPYSGKGAEGCTGNC